MHSLRPNFHRFSFAILLSLGIAASTRADLRFPLPLLTSQGVQTALVIDRPAISPGYFVGGGILPGVGPELHKHSCESQGEALRLGNLLAKIPAPTCS